jgi:hypothetical protein
VVVPQLDGLEMTGTNNLNLGNLIDNPLFDFIKVLSSNPDNDNSNSFSFFDSDDFDFPYNNGNFDSTYVDHMAVCNSRLNEKINIMSFNILTEDSTDIANKFNAFLQLSLAKSPQKLILVMTMLSQQCRIANLLCLVYRFLTQNYLML